TRSKRDWSSDVCSSDLGDLRDDTARDRLAMLDTGLRLVRAHPITGVGPGQVKQLYPVWAGPEALRRSTSHLHNTPLQIAVERGEIGRASGRERAYVWGA